MPAEPGDLFAIQEELLDAAVASLEYLTNFDLLGAPARRLVVPPGDLALDCEQVIVNALPVTTLGTRPTSPPVVTGRRHVTGRITGVLLQVAVVRCCLPIGTWNNTTYTPPNAGELMNATEQLSADGWALWNGIFSRLKNEEFLSRCTAVEWNAMAPLGPSGACAGWSLPLRVQLAGYMEPEGT